MFSATQYSDTFSQKRADALVLMSEHFLSTMDDGIKPLSGGDKYQVIVHIDAKIMDKTSETHAWLEDGPGIGIETARRLACDASMVTVVEDTEGKVLNVGRKTRTVPPSIRRALNLRDHSCRFPGCTSQYVDAHHIQHWCDGGETSLDNLVLLCRYHHRLLHQKVFSITRDNQGELMFMNSQNNEIKPNLYPQFDKCNTKSLKPLKLELENQELGLEIDWQTAVTKWTGEYMDYHMAAEALFKRDYGL